MYTPKPTGYYRIPFPERAYQTFQEPGFPYSFEYPVYARVVRDSTFFGAPTEVYGFSNNARGFFGKPAYAETLVKIDSSQTIKFKLE